MLAPAVGTCEFTSSGSILPLDQREIHHARRRISKAQGPRQQTHQKHLTPNPETDDVLGPSFWSFFEDGTRLDPRVA